MRAWVRRSLIGMGVLLVVAAGAYYWLFVESHVPGDAAFDFDIEQVRQMVRVAPGARPVAVEVEQVASFRFPATAVMAGEGWELRDMPVFSYRLAYPDAAVIIDTGLNAEQGGSELASFDAEAYARVQAAVAQSSLVLITHEHFDHIGGLMAHPDVRSLIRSARLNPEQLEHLDRAAPAKFPDGALDGYQPLAYRRYHLIAPGVVLIRAAGHTPGSQMVYVETADGSELLFIGDVAWQVGNIERVRERARLVTWLLLKEDRKAVFGQLAALKQLHESQPRVHIVPGHDGTVVDSLVKAGALRRQFSIGTAAATAP